MADEKKITEHSDGALDYTGRLAEANANIDRVKKESEAYKNARREEEAQKAKDEAKLQDEERRKLEEEEKKRKRIAEERLAALSYAETYRERIRKERDSAALEKKRMDAERRRQEQIEKELEAKSALIEQQKRENSDRTAKFDELIARINSAMNTPEKVDTPLEQQVKTEEQISPAHEEKTAPVQILRTEETAAPTAPEKEEDYVLNISTEDVGRDLLHIEGMSVGDISISAPSATVPGTPDVKEKESSPSAVAPLVVGAVGAAISALANKEDKVDTAAPIAEQKPKEIKPLTEQSTPKAPATKKQEGNSLEPTYPDPVPSDSEASRAFVSEKNGKEVEKLSRAEQKRREREEYKRFLAENDQVKSTKTSEPPTDDDPYANVGVGEYGVLEPKAVRNAGKNTDLSDIDKYEREIENRGSYSEPTDSKANAGKKDTKVPESTEPVYPDPDLKAKKISGKDARKQKKEAEDRERQALLEADRFAREEEKRKAKEKAKSDAQAVGVKEYPDYDASREKAKRDKRAEGEELASLAKEDEKKRRKNKGGKDKPKAAPIFKDGTEKFDRKKIDALVKEQSKNDEKLVKLHFENRIRALKFESDSLDLRFSSAVGKEKKNRAKMGYSINETKKNLKVAAKLERADNERYYTLVKCDLNKTKIPRRTNRAEIEKMREELIELLNRRDELNLALSELYTGKTGKKSRSHAHNAEAKEYAAKVKEFKRQRKLAKELDRMSVSSDNRRKIYQLMDECVELAGRRAELEYKLRKEKVKGRAKREAAKEIRTVKKDYKFASKDLERFSHRAFVKAAKRKKSHSSTALGIFLLLLLVGAGVAVYMFRDTIWQFITSLIPM